MVENYINFLKYEKKYSPHTIKSYEDDISDFSSFLEREKINRLVEVTYTEVKFYLRNHQRKLKSTTVSRRISSLRSFYRFLKNEGQIKTNPFSLVKSPKKEKKLPSFLYQDELFETFEHINIKTPLGVRNKLIFELLYATGIRASELINIKLSDLDLNDKKILIYGKGSKERYVNYGSVAYNLLEEYLNNTRRELIKEKNHQFLIINHLGDKITTRGVGLIIEKIIKDTALKNKISPHSLRHTFATHLLNEGADLLTVKELLGHSSLSSTQIYTHITDDKLKEIYNKAHPRSSNK